MIRRCSKCVRHKEPSSSYEATGILSGEGAQPPMRPPIIIAEGLDVSFFRSAEAAALALEGPDVVDGIYRAYDADGRPLALAARGGPRRPAAARATTARRW